MQTTSTTKTGTVEFMPSKGGYIPGTGVRGERAITTLNYTVEATLKQLSSKPRQKKESYKLSVVVQVGERRHQFTVLQSSDKLPGDRQCKKWVEEHVKDLLPDKNATGIKVK